MNTKAILAGAAMLIVAGLPAAAAAQNAIAGATVNFRAGPSGPVIGTIPYGAPVTVLGRSGNWCQTEWHGRIGWVYCRYLHAAVAQAPLLVPEPYYPYGYGGYPYRYGGPTVGFSFGFGDFDRGFRHRDRPRRHGSRHFRRGGDDLRGGGRGSRGGGSSGTGNPYLQALERALN